jgi:hypothetical protein
MASITVAEVITELKNRGFEGFSPADLQRYIDWGFRKIVRMASWDWEQDIISVTQQIGDYTLGIDPLSTEIPLLRDLTRIIDSTAGSMHELQPMTEDEYFDRWATADLSAAANRGTPDRYFFAWKNQIYILPPPNSIRTYQVYYYKYIGDAASGLNALPNDWEEAVLLSAECICHYRARQPQFAQECEARLQEMLYEMLTEQGMKDPETPERVDGPWSRVR